VENSCYNAVGVGGGVCGDGGGGGCGGDRDGGDGDGCGGGGVVMLCSSRLSNV